MKSSNCVPFIKTLQFYQTLSVSCVHPDFKNISFVIGEVPQLWSYGKSFSLFLSPLFRRPLPSPLHWSPTNTLKKQRCWSFGFKIYNSGYQGLSMENWIARWAQLYLGMSIAAELGKRAGGGRDWGRVYQSSHNERTQRDKD